MTHRTLRALAGLAVALSLVLSTCTSSDFGETRYTLQSINGRPLPASPIIYPGVPPYGYVISGSLRLRADGYATQVLMMRCSPDRPADAECSLPRNGRLVQEGWRDGPIALFEGTMVYLMEEDGGVTVSWACPPSLCGFAYATRFEYR